MATKQVANTEKRKPPAAGKGRPKGARNKTTTALKEAILHAAAQHGYDGEGEGQLQGYLLKVAEDDTRAFCALLGKVLPMTVASDPDNPLKVIHAIELVSVPALPAPK